MEAIGLSEAWGLRAETNNEFLKNCRPINLTDLAALQFFAAPIMLIFRENKPAKYTRA